MHAGETEPTGALVGVSGRGFIASALKMSDFRESVILRVFNPTHKDTKMKLDLDGRFGEVYAVNLNEDRQKKIIVRSGKCTVDVPAKKIVTVELVPVK